ncbi:double-stranded RNA-binding protein 2-like [Cucurbita pepo subsp. pepo]|uniref:double-stranded RNA-binding protein 2-like n=1 Tax=Cucurbita pepo subsp. pepo TaxID=3664 RepID=UPI000C9D82DB|nr:double-stranded RNA-binding protein 2-like [Cucurbita pepo subsp. pepo]
MYKNQLQELAQRSCFNLPSYTCIREGPDHAPRFKATVNFNGEVFECPQYCSTLRQAEHSAAEVALNALSNRGPPHSLAARILDETGVYKNLLQEIAQRVGAPLPQYTTFRSGLGHLPVFTGIVELAGITFTGEPAKNKKQAEKNAAMAAWSALKQLAKQSASSSSEPENNDELEQITIARALLNYRQKEKMAMSNPNATIPFPRRLHIQSPRPTSPQRPPAPTSKILPLICQKAAPRSRAPFSANKILIPQSPTSAVEGSGTCPQKFSAGAALSYIPVQQFRASCRGIAPPVTIRTAMPVYSAPPLPQPSKLPPQQVTRVPPVRIAPPVSIRQAIPAFAAPPLRKESPPVVKKEDCPASTAPKEEPPAPPAPSQPTKSPAEVEEQATTTMSNSQQEIKTLENLEQLQI